MINKELSNKIKGKKTIHIKGKKFSIIGLESCDELVKFRLTDNKKDLYWFEFQFNSAGLIILWKDIDFQPKNPNSNVIKYKCKQFKLSEKGDSEVEVTINNSTKKEKIKWWDYSCGNEMLSLGWNKTSKKWDNLNGHIIKIKDIKITY